MNNRDRTGEAAALGCLLFLAFAFINILVCFGIGWIASKALSAFYPHDYPLWGFALVVFLVLWLVNLPAALYRKKNRPTLSSSDNRYNFNNW